MNNDLYEDKSIALLLKSFWEISDRTKIVKKMVISNKIEDNN